jgi:hypothetical protein
MLTFCHCPHTRCLSWLVYIEAVVDPVIGARFVRAMAQGSGAA